MSYSGKYAVWFTLGLQHGYYGDGKIPVYIELTEKMQALFRKYDLTMRRWKQNEWTLLAPEHFEGIEETEFLTFLIIPSDPVFYYVSDSSVQMDYGKTTLLPGIWKEMEIPQKDLPEQILLTIPVKASYWEILLFPSAEKYDYPLQLHETRGRIPFREMEKITWLDGSTVFRICSQRKIPMQAIYEYRFRLTEDRNGKERILSEMVPVPRPDQLSVTGEKETITSYFNL